MQSGLEWKGGRWLYSRKVHAIDRWTRLLLRGSEDRHCETKRKIQTDPDDPRMMWKLGEKMGWWWYDTTEHSLILSATLTDQRRLGSLDMWLHHYSRPAYLYRAQRLIRIRRYSNKVGCAWRVGRLDPLTNWLASGRCFATRCLWL